LAISREKKEQQVENLKEKFGSAEVIILTDFRGLSVGEQQELRSRLRDSASDYVVVKNTLTKVALEQANRPIPAEHLTGPTALAFLHEDIAAPAKALLDFAKETGILVIKGGIVGDRIVAAGEVEDLADLPPREVLLAQLIGAIQGPAATLVGVLEAPARELVRTLQAPMQELALTIQAYADQNQ
jgi:large subunit ribosomal protein L10